MKELLKLFLTFAKIGGLTFGGGYAMLPMLQREVVEKNKWATEEELMDYYAIGQCTPGVIAVNTATFVGQSQKGTWGAIFATAGVVFPSFVIISLIATVLTNFSHIPEVKYAFAGIRVCVCVLIFNAVVKLFKKSVPDAVAGILFAVVLLASVIFDVSPILIVPIAAVIGIGVQLWRCKQK